MTGKMSPASVKEMADPQEKETWTPNTNNNRHNPKKYCTGKINTQKMGVRRQDPGLNLGWPSYPKPSLSMVLETGQGLGDVQAPVTTRAGGIRLYWRDKDRGAEKMSQLRPRIHWALTRHSALPENVHDNWFRWKKQKTQISAWTGESGLIFSSLESSQIKVRAHSRRPQVSKKENTDCWSWSG